MELKKKKKKKNPRGQGENKEMGSWQIDNQGKNQTALKQRKWHPDHPPLAAVAAAAAAAAAAFWPGWQRWTWPGAQSCAAP